MGVQWMDLNGYSKLLEVVIDPAFAVAKLLKLHFSSFYYCNLLLEEAAQIHILVLFIQKILAFTF
ncbi:hypothetical protein SLEP1_g18387 [Rubroshorea leprosula]|uniref:Uncharacterized protein n=1 Tax=Rubroshorea leprosula TaxID=152421 RepID=A0AAV5J7W2_9ROSI|nr:hypothetical protein SLEP1_g18387 [Rubroshorea leprosula]